MALTLPLHIFDGIYRCFRHSPGFYLCANEEERLAEALISDATIFDVIRWRRISSVFQRVADQRLKSYKRINVRMYNGLAQMHNHKCDRGNINFCLT